ncbi:hypothetical protein SUGI_1020610 [Cryptomeria japonica]|uniref:protein TRIGALACTOSYLDIACYLGLYCEROL 4, chloroplastic n=1 Tax=Cryptomeria japonica TaxID=3369 RepID=UPI002414A152|nr:protein TRIGALACTOSYLDIACYLGLYCEROL 4, chloroplastic [Cryptomeria japonica]GLJ48346.1 hypothetical protein SUGI_1020610 [Cryptomeria japonica]
MGKTHALMDAHFWDTEIASPASMNGVVGTLPDEGAAPLSLTQSSKLSRPRQVMFMHRFLHLPLLPSYSPTQGGLVFDRAVVSFQGSNWWTTLTGQFRIQKFLSGRKYKASENVQKSAGSKISNLFGGLWDPLLYAHGIASRVVFGEHTSLTASSELSSNDKDCRARAILHHKLPQHDLSLETSWHGRFVQTQGSSWNAPLSISLDLTSLESDSGLRYRIGIRHNSGLPQECDNGNSTEIPWVVSPGLSAKAAISFEKHAKIWKDQSGPRLRQKPYNLFLSQPHVTVSTIIGSTLNAIKTGNTSSAKLKMLPVETQSNEDGSSSSSLQAKVQRSPFSADLFASLGCAAQLGRFQKPLLDLTRLEARLDIGTASAFATGATWLRHKYYRSALLDVQDREEVSHPSLAIMMQQQIAGPLSARIDSRYSLDFSSSKCGLHVKEIVYGLDFSLKVLTAAKVLAWYSPTRKEAMVELRLLDR